MDQLFMYHSLCYTGFITECSSEASQGKLFQVVGQFLFKMSGLQPPSSRVAYNFHNVPLCPEFSQNFQVNIFQDTDWLFELIFFPSDYSS